MTAFEEAPVTDAETGGLGELQFDRVVPKADAVVPASDGAVSCAACQASIETEYFDVNGQTTCGRCRRAAEIAAETPLGAQPLVTAIVFGLGAGIVGAAIYYGVIALVHLQIGYIALLIGYMVGSAVRKGAKGGGLRFQIIAVALTYLSVALAYSPIVFKQIAASSRKAQAARDATTNGRPAGSPRATPSPTRPPTAGGFVIGVGALAALIVALPVLIVVGSMPSGLLSALIVAIGMRQAWRMTAAPWVQVLGPYRVGSAPDRVLT
jgi:hypothetical protein